MSASQFSTAAEGKPRRLFTYNGGFLTQPRLRRILQLSGYQLKIGTPGPDDMVGVWGQSPTAHRGEAMAAKANVPLLRVEDAFLRSVLPGRVAKEPPLGLFLDSKAVHFDPSVPSDLEILLATAPLDDTALLNRARDAIARIKSAQLSKYNAHDPAADIPDPGYVLVIDQTQGDASVTASGADRIRFQEMLVFAQTEHPHARVLIKSHPETEMGARPGYFTEADATGRVEFYRGNAPIWPLFESAIAVYTVSSQIGFEAIFAGHKPRIFGQPFYAGWGLTVDEYPVPRRQRKLTRSQMFAAAMILYPKWYDPFADRLCDLDRVISVLEANTRAWQADQTGYVAHGMALWKRGWLKRGFGTCGAMRFSRRAPITQAQKLGAPVLVWARHATAELLAQAKDANVGVTRLEDGFLRSRGLGAALVPPLSLIADQTGVYYDAHHPSDMEAHIRAAGHATAQELGRAAKFRRALISGALSKYNQGGSDMPDLPPGKRILVPGQVADDASIKMGTDKIDSNLALLETVRAENPEAVILYKPHPDVEAGLRAGQLDQARDVADVVLENCDPIAAINVADEIWTMTSLLGFEALLRDKPVTCLGMPFYAGWGLTRDLGGDIGGALARRSGIDLSVDALVHAAYIAAPRYFDPTSGAPCPPETVLEHLQSGAVVRASRGLRLSAKFQGLLASYAHLWRR